MNKIEIKTSCAVAKMIIHLRSFFMIILIECLINKMGIQPVYLKVQKILYRTDMDITKYRI